MEHLVDLENFSATPGDGRVRLEWTNPFDTTIRKYQYRYMSTSDSGWNPDWTDASGLDGSETTPMVALLITGLTNGIEYTFQVRPVYLQSGLEVPGNEAEVKSAPRGALLAPGSFTASSAGDGELALGWSNPNDVTITGYQYRHRKHRRHRLEPRLDQHAGKRRDDGCGHADGAGEQSSLHSGVAGVARR